MRGLVQVMQTQAQMQTALQTPLQVQVPAPAQQDRGVGGASIMERFKRMVPPPFKGESQPLVAENWLREIEKIFRAIRQESEMELYLEEKKARMKRLPEPFQRQNRKMKKIMEDLETREIDGHVVAIKILGKWQSIMPSTIVGVQILDVKFL
ncbi:hypothetical protein Taro_052154 [Colocasia esculenta]|uniref:Uncharacterized protein n=1 Tax=Colocasia esculenta TaxID=4460 RepID=A0A843XHU9_COLES|nr:hypothetical protein [Colocasia esculenta]